MKVTQDEFKTLLKDKGAKKKKRKSTPEGLVVKYILDAGNFEAGVHLFRRNVGTIAMGGRVFRSGQVGQSDITGYIEETRCPVCGALTGTARHVEIEVKAAGGVPTAEQVQWLLDCSKDGVISLVMKPRPDETDIRGYNKINEAIKNLSYCECQDHRKEDWEPIRFIGFTKTEIANAYKRAGHNER